MGGRKLNKNPMSAITKDGAMSGVQSARKESNKPIMRPQVECAGASCGYNAEWSQGIGACARSNDIEATDVDYNRAQLKA